MIKKSTFAEQILQFNYNLSYESLDLPAGFKIINPFNSEQKELTKIFSRENDDDLTRFQTFKLEKLPIIKRKLLSYI